jgi:2',3'-cyclic-nucleotide 2'-phosphodiesterase (5'-nucleotidase family)
MLRRDLLSRAGLGMLALAIDRGEALADEVTITILHCNDVYEIAPKDGSGGFAPFMTLLKAERARNPLTLTTFGGDLLSPSLLSGLTKGSQMIELTNAVGIQVAVVGNHEFDFGSDLAAQRIKASRYPWLGTNVLAADGAPAVGCADLQLFELGGYRIGLFGILTPETATLSSPGDAISFAAPAATAAAAVKRLKEMGADLVVALTHLYVDDDLQLVAGVEGVDLVLGGHDHEAITFYEGDTLIVKAASDLRFLAAVDLRVGRAMVKDKEVVVWAPSWRYLDTAGAPPDPEIEAVVARWTTTLDQELAVPVGVTKVDLDTRRASVRTEETNFGDLVADAMRNATGAEVALANGGGIRGDRLYPAGSELTRKDILTEMPFGNTVVVAEVTGADLLAALENGVSAVADKAGRFPQVSGLRFTYDESLPAGSRIVAVEVGGAPLEPQRSYRLATIDYLLTGGDGYAALKNAKVLVDASAGRLLASTVMNYITAQGGAVTLTTDGRIARRG